LISNSKDLFCFGWNEMGQVRKLKIKLQTNIKQTNKQTNKQTKQHE